MNGAGAELLHMWLQGIEGFSVTKMEIGKKRAFKHQKHADSTSVIKAEQHSKWRLDCYSLTWKWKSIFANYQVWRKTVTLMCSQCHHCKWKSHFCELLSNRHVWLHQQSFPCPEAVRCLRGCLSWWENLYESGLLLTAHRDDLHHWYDQNIGLIYI